MKSHVLKICNLISAIVLAVLLCLFCAFGVMRLAAVYAAESPEVLQDLLRDKDFDESIYSYVKDDYGLYVIQIAESSNKELFVYVYQPCHDTYDLIGTKISISYGYSVNGAGLSPKLYNLRLISTSGTLDKYYVDGFTVPNDGDRYYNIVEIFRMVNTEIDGEQDPTTPKTDIAYSVGQQWYACDLNGSKRYEMNTFKTLQVETVWTDDIVIHDGFTLGSLLLKHGMCNVWFYCFNVDEYVINHIFDGDINYSVRDVIWSNVGTGDGYENYFNERENQALTLTDIDEMIYKGHGLGSRTHSWNRILSSEKFVSTVEEQGNSFDSVVREKILSSQWVFSFLETERIEHRVTGSVRSIEYSDVYDVGLLRLHFQDVTGNYYDLGVVNDLTNPDNVSGGEINDLAEQFKEFWEMFVKIIFGIIFVIVLVVLLNFVPPIKKLFKWIFEFIGKVISAPFKLLKSIFKKGG